MSEAAVLHIVNDNESMRAALNSLLCSIPTRSTAINLTFQAAGRNGRALDFGDQRDLCGNWRALAKAADPDRAPAL